MLGAGRAWATDQGIDRRHNRSRMETPEPTGAWVLVKAPPLRGKKTAP